MKFSAKRLALGSGTIAALWFGALTPALATSYVDSDAVTTTQVTTVATPTKVTTTTTTTTIESLDFRDPTWLNGADRMNNLSFETVSAGTLTITPHGASASSKLVVGSLGLGVDSCNALGFCGFDNDVDVFLKNGKFYGESITFTFDKTVTLKSAEIVDGIFGGNTFGISVDGGAVTGVHMGSWGLWAPTGLMLTGKSFTFSAFNPAGLKTFDDFYIDGLVFKTVTSTSVVTTIPEPQSLALALAGVAVVGGTARMRRAARH